MPSSPKQPSPSSRSHFRRLLDSIIGEKRQENDPQRGSLLLETLESRQMLAGDVELLFTDGTSDVADQSTAAETNILQSTRQAEGEAAPDLVEFAKRLADSGTQFFGAHWCPACTEQKELFADGKDNLPFIEVTNPDRTLNSIGSANNITQFPTWVFPDQSRETGVLSLQELSQRSGVAIPESEDPTFETIGDTTIRLESPFHIPVDAYDPNGGPLTVTVSIDDPTIAEATVLSGNRSIRINMAGYGDMVFELFEQRAPRPSERVADLADADFYNGIIFHRVTSDFVIQAGDPTGTGTSGSNLGNFDDQFHPDLQHNRSGVLSFAKSSDDTNNSQFFVTEGPARFLDGNHSIFGQLVEGEDVREAISSTSTPESRNAGSSQRPDNDVVIESIDVFNDTENSVIMMRGLRTGSTNVTVTVRDQDGNTHNETFQLNVVADNANTQPFLNEITDPAAFPNDTPATLQLSSIDVEGDAVRYFAQSVSSPASGTATVNPTTGLVTVTPAAGFEGVINVQVGVEPTTPSNDFDSQIVAFTFSGGVLSQPTGIDLETGSDTGSSNIDNVTSAGSLTFTVTGVDDGATVELLLVGSNTVIGTGLASGTTATITTANLAALGDGTYEIAARQRDSSSTSEISTARLTVVYDSTDPDSVISTIPSQANVGRAFETDLINSEEGSGLTYAFTTSPTGAVVDPTTGVITWTPTSSQAGTNAFVLEVTDLAGNTRTENFSIDVANEPLVGIKIELTDLQGTPIDSIAVGQEFLMNFIGVDLREFSFQRDGVFAAFADILFDSSLVRPVQGSSIDYADRFPAVNKGAFSSGLINELGAASDRTVASAEEESLIATVRFEALGTGSVNIRSEPADEVDSEVLLYGLDDLVTSDQIEYGSASLAVGQSFVIADDTFDVAEDSGETTFNVLANDAIVAGSNVSLSVVSVTQPTTGGNVVLDGGEVKFTPSADFNGDLTFTYRVSDTNGIQEDATVTVSVTPVNDSPVAVADTFNVDQDSTGNTLDVLDNDSDIDADTLTVVSVGTTDQGGTVTITNNGADISYTPASGFTGTETFTYTVSDGALEQQTTVTVTVAPADNPPTANDDAFTIDEDDAEAEFDVTTNDDRDVDDQTFVIDSVGTPSDGGTARISSDGTQFFYTPAADFNGTATVPYTIRDTGGGLSVGTVTFTVNAINDAPPVTNPDRTVNRASGETEVFSLADLPQNVDAGETLTFENLGTTSAGGTVRIDATTQRIFYTPPSGDFTGTDTFTVEIHDGTQGSVSTATVTVEVTDFTVRNIVVDFPDSFTPVDGIRLRGTNDLGDSVDLPLVYDSSAGRFEDLLPGSYTLEIPAIPFLAKAQTAQSIPVVSEADDGDMTIDTDLGSLLPRYITLQDFLGSTPTKSILVAVNDSGDQLFAEPTEATDTVSEPAVSLDPSGENIVIRGKDDAGDDIQATIPTSDSRVQLRGEANGAKLYRVSVEDDDVSFEAVTTPSTNASPEFIESQFVPAPNPSAAASGTTPEITVGERQPEGELVVQSTSVADVFVPVTDDGNSRSDAVVLPTNSGDLWLGENSEEKVGVADSVDTALTDVAPQLSVAQSSADDLEDEKQLDALAIDEVLASNID